MNVTATTRASADYQKPRGRVALQPVPLGSALSGSHLCAGLNNRRNVRARPSRRQIVHRLQVRPEFRRRTKGLGQQPGRMGRNTALATNDFIHTLNGNSQMGRQRFLGKTHRLKKLVEQDHPRMRSCSVCWNHILTSIDSTMVVHHGHVVCARPLPTKYNPPLNVDSNAVKACIATPQRLQAIARRRAQIIKRLGGVQDIEFVNRRIKNLRRQAPNFATGDTVKQVGGGPIAERLDHRAKSMDSRNPCNAGVIAFLPVSDRSIVNRRSVGASKA